MKISLYFFIMNSITFIFLVCLYALFFIYEAIGGIQIENQIIYCSMLIIAFGIPHGALDHILFFKKRDTSQIRFYSIYLGLILFFVFLWIYFPVLSLTLFLIISAFHFGESQFEDIDIKKYSNSLLLYLIWGLSLLINLIFYNVNELNDLTTFFEDTESFYYLYNHKFITYGFILFNIITVCMLMNLLLKKIINWNKLLSELFLFGLIHLTFYLFPFIIGFTLYFVVLHSIRVMKYEYNFLKNNSINFNLIVFLKLITPYTLLSLFFSGLVFILSYEEVIPISIPLLSLIIISAITLPHAIVMHIFYNE